MKWKCKTRKQKQESKVRGQSRSLKVSSFLSLHVFSSLWFFFSLCFFFLTTWKEKNARRKHMKRKCKNGKAEAITKSEKAERELEGKLPPFFWFFFSCFLVCFIFFVFEKKKKKRTLWPSFLCLRRRWWHKNVPLSFSLVVLRFNLVVFGVYRV